MSQTWEKKQKTKHQVKSSVFPIHSLSLTISLKESKNHVIIISDGHYSRQIHSRNLVPSVAVMQQQCCLCRYHKYATRSCSARSKRTIAKPGCPKCTRGKTTYFVQKRIPEQKPNLKTLLKASKDLLMCGFAVFYVGAIGS